MLKLHNLSKRFVMHHLGGRIIEGFSNISLQVSCGGSMGISGGGSPGLWRTPFRKPGGRTGRMKCCGRE